MPLWSVEEWRVRIGSCWCAFGRPINTRFTRNRGKSRRVLTLRQLLTMVIMVMLLIVANLVLCAMHLKMSSALFDGGGNGKLSLLRFVLILNISLGVLTTAVQTVHHSVLSYQAQVSLRQFFVDLAHSLWLIRYLFQFLTYPGWLMINSLQNGITSLFKGISKNLIKCTRVPGLEFPPGSLRLSLVIVVMVGAQLFISVSISRAVISLLLMTSGDVERNPGPTQSSKSNLVRIHCSHQPSQYLISFFGFTMRRYLCPAIKVTGTTFGGTVLLVLLLQAMTAVQTTLLMRSGDVEMNPGPGLYPDLDYDDVDSTIILSEDDFREVFRCTVGLKPCYYELGIELGLPPQAVQDKTVGNPLAGVLLAWLNQRYDTERYGIPTWRRLVEAVDNPAGGNNHELAKTIASKHPTVQDQSKEPDEEKSPERQTESVTVEIQPKEPDEEKSPERQTESVTVEIQPKESDNEKSPERLPETVRVQSESDDEESPERQPENVTSKDASADAPSDEEAHSSDVSHEAERKTQSVHITCEEYVGENLDEILQRIQDYHGLWKVIGAELGIEVDVLDMIEKNYQQDIDCLHSLTIHLPYGHDSSRTYQALVKAFKSERASDAISAINDVQTALTMAWDYHEVWRSIGVELNIDESVLDSIEKSHSGHHDCLRALIEVWLAGSRLTDAGRETMTNALQSVRVAIAIAARPVRSKDLKRVFNVKLEHYRLWKLLGTELGIDVDTLNDIEENHSAGSRNCLRVMIDSADPKITHRALATALQSEVITNAIADPPLVAQDLDILCRWEHFKIWRIIGTELGIDADTLDTYEKTDHDCLRRMISEAKPPITHSAMTKVLQSERITNAVAAILNNIEVNEILSLAVEHYRSWKSIGLELGIDGAALNAIEKKYVNDHRRLIAMIELWHASVDLNPSQEAMTKALQSNRVTTSVVDFTPSHGEPLLEQRDYSCDSEVMVDGDIFTYPYYWDIGNVALAVKILQSLTRAKNYFEHKILSPGIICAVTIGIVGRDYPLDMQPGWTNEGIGYHADDGKLFNENGAGTPFGPTCTTGDRMGCGVIFEDGDSESSDYVKVFFTKNGKQVGDIVNFKRPASGQGLYPLMGLSSRGEQFQYLGTWHHLPNVSQVSEHNNEERKGYEEELNKLLASEGHVELDISKVILTGAAGSGKTCTKLLLYKLPPPVQRQSTELIEPMDRAYIKHELAYHEEDDSEYEWIVVESGSESLYSMLAATVDSGEYTVLCEHEDTDGISMENLPSVPTDEESESSLPKSPTIVQSSDSNSRSPSELSKKSTPSSKKADGMQKHIERQDSKARESLLMKLKNSVDQKGVCVHKVRWIHLVDSGGQSQFHDILPTFLHHTSVIIYVLKLSEPLDDQPFDNYFEDGERLGESRRSHYDVEQILNGVIQSAYYEKHNVANEKHTTKIMIIGTHKDVQAGGESIDVKNSKLKKIFEPFVGSRQLEVLCHGDYNADDIIFPLDAMKRDQESLGTGRDIRKRIVSKGSKTHKVPISWFLLEQDLRSVGGEENNGVITIGECTKLAKAINVSKLKSALEYFHSLNIFLFFPHSSVLSEIVFTDPQVVVTIVSAFVKEAYQKVTDTEFKNFSERGEFTKSFVKSKLSRFLVPAARFEEAEVIELLKITLVVAHIEEGRYFMPCVLPHCSLDEFEKERNDLEVPAVILKLPGDTHCVPRGFFCALVCGLMKKWKLRKKKGKEVDVFKNFVQFTVDGYRVVVADTFYYIEIHVSGCDPDRYICRKIYEDIGEALKVVVNTHNYNNEIVESYSLDFLCPCGSAPAHTALIFSTGRKQRLNCTRDDDETFKLENKFLIWLEDPVPESVPHPPILKQESESKLKINLGALLILKYTDKGEKKKVRIINKASHKWKDIASLLSDDANITSVLEQKHRGDPSECLKETFTEYFINKKPEDYSQDWDGMIELLDDVGLEALAEEVKHALSCITSA